MAPAAAGAAAGSAGPGGPGGGRQAMEEQHVWIYCRQQEETESILLFCRSAENMRRIPQVVESLGTPEWRAALKLRLHEPPPCYGAGAWKDFLSDADALLGASWASVLQRRGQERSPGGAPGLGALRWPSLLVTDRRKLCQALCDDVLRTVLAEAASLQRGELLPVVLATDFKLLCGYITEEAPLEITGSAALADGQPPGHGGGAREAEVELTPGVYMQSFVVPTDAKGGDCGSATQASCVFGVRCLALLNGGRCAYVAVSADGLRRLEASGSWEVVNGHLLVGGVSGRASVAQLQLEAPGPRPLPEAATAATRRPGLPLIVGLDELSASFEPVVPLSKCMEQIPEAALPAAAKARPGAEGGRPPAGGAAARDSLGAAQPNAEACRTSSSSLVPPADCLLTCSRLSSNTESEMPATARSVPAQAHMPLPPATPRSPSAASRPRPASGQARGAASPDPSASSWTYTTCPLRPGTYRYEVGQEGNRSFRLFNLTLQVDGSYIYRDMHFRTALSADLDNTAWQVRGGVLSLSHKKRGSLGFLLTQLRGKREVERRVARVEIPVDLILAKCTFTPFEQDAAPFPAHEPKPASRRLGGWLDPSALAATADPRIEPDSIPLRDFEDELKHAGVNLHKEGVSDIRFLDSNEDGLVTRGELRELARLGAPVATGEVLYELSEALLAVFGSLAQAFEFFQSSAAVEKLSFENFDGGLRQVLSDKKLKGKATKLKNWYKDKTQEDIEAVFSSVNPSKIAAISLADFLSLSLHTAFFALRQLEAFQAFLLERFGQGRDALQAAFEAIDFKHKHEITDKTFAEGVKKIGYKLGDVNIFGLMDLGFSGKVTSSEFLMLRHLNVKQLLDGLQALKDGVLRRFGSLDGSFESLAQGEEVTADGQPELSISALAKEHEKGTLGSDIAADYLAYVFLFLSEAAGRAPDGRLTREEWRLLEAFDLQTISGCRSRLRACFETRFGTLDETFAQIQGSWLPRLIESRLRRATLEGLAAALRPASPARKRASSGAAAKAGAGPPASAGAAAARADSKASERPHTHCGVRSSSSRDGRFSARGAAVITHWPKPGPFKQVNVMCEARMPTPVHCEHWTVQPRQYQPAWPMNEDAPPATAPPRGGVLPGLAARPMQWERPGAISAINWPSTPRVTPAVGWGLA